MFATNPKSYRHYRQKLQPGSDDEPEAWQGDGEFGRATLLRGPTVMIKVPILQTGLERDGMRVYKRSQLNESHEDHEDEGERAHGGAMSITLERRMRLTTTIDVEYSLINLAL